MNISVVLASFNGGKYIEQQLESIIHQLNREDELIISDDYSTDDTLEIIRKYEKLDNVRIVMNQGNGFLENFSTAIKYATKDIVVFSDQDDIWLNGRIEKIRSLFKSGASLVVLNSTYVDADLTPLDCADPRIIRWKKGFFQNLIKNTYTGANMSVDRKFLNEIMPFPKNVLFHDVWISLLAEYYKKDIKYSSQEFTLYRRHGNNVTGIRNKTLKVIKNRVVLIISLFFKIVSIKKRRLL